MEKSKPNEKYALIWKKENSIEEFSHLSQVWVWDLQFNLYLSSIYYLTFDEAKAVVSKLNPIFWNKNYIYFDGFLA